MSAENKALARRVVKEIWNKGRLELVDGLYAQNFSYEGAMDQAQGRDGYKAMVSKYRSAFPDLQLTIDELIAEGNKVVVRWRCRGTHTADLPDVPATGKKINMRGITVVRLRRGKVVDEKTVEDSLGMMQQLGVIPQLGQAKPQVKAVAAEAS